MNLRLIKSRYVKKKIFLFYVLKSLRNLFFYFLREIKKDSRLYTQPSTYQIKLSRKMSKKKEKTKQTTYNLPIVYLWSVDLQLSAGGQRRGDLAYFHLTFRPGRPFIYFGVRLTPTMNYYSSH